MIKIGFDLHGNEIIASDFIDPIVVFATISDSVTDDVKDDIYLSLKFGNALLCELEKVYEEHGARGSLGHVSITRIMRLLGDIDQEYVKYFVEKRLLRDDRA